MIDRANLAEDLARHLRDRIVDGVIAAGERINEVRLAQELGVSRTPLREALTRLVGEGALEIRSRRGFFVRPLTLEEFDQIYPIRAILDPEALALVEMPFPAARLRRLERINRDLTKANDARRVIDLDDDWHRELLAGCPNRVLLDLIEEFMRRTRRYEIAYMDERQNVTVALDEHEAVMDALRDGDLPRACDALKQNLKSGVEPIRVWLRTEAEQ